MAGRCCWRCRPLECMCVCSSSSTIAAMARISPVGRPTTGVALSAFVVMVVMVRRGRDAAAFFSSSAMLAFLLATVSAGLYPNMLKSSTDPSFSMTVTNASAASNTLTVMLIVAIIGIPFVLLYTAGVQYIFRGKVKLTASSY